MAITSRKPHSDNAGYVCELKCKLGGHIVIYDRDALDGAIAADYRWIVMHEPSSLHVAVRGQAQARDVMKGVAKASSVDEAREYADILPTITEGDDDPVEVPAAAGDRKAALERFLADPENEPSPEGLAALREAFKLKESK